jgi:hypothetical protein
MNRIARIGEDYDERGIITLVLIIISLFRNCKFQPSMVKNSLKWLNRYLENRRQGIKIGNNYSEWDTLIKGVPQGSILGPVL